MILKQKKEIEDVFIRFVNKNKLKIEINDNNIIFSNIQSSSMNRILFDFIEDTMFFITKNGSDSESGIKDYLITNNEISMSVEFIY